MAGAEAEAGAEARGGLEAAWAEAAGPGAPSRETAHAWNAAVPSGSPDGAAPPPPAPGPPPPPPTPTPAGAEKAAKALPTGEWPASPATTRARFHPHSLITKSW